MSVQQADRPRIPGRARKSKKKFEAKMYNAPAFFKERAYLMKSTEKGKNADD